MSHYSMGHVEAHGKINGIPFRSALAIPYNVDCVTRVRWKLKDYHEGTHIKKVDYLLGKNSRDSRFYKRLRDEFGLSHCQAVSALWGES